MPLHLGPPLPGTPWFVIPHEQDGGGNRAPPKPSFAAPGFTVGPPMPGAPWNTHAPGSGGGPTFTPPTPPAPLPPGPPVPVATSDVEVPPRVPEIKSVQGQDRLRRFTEIVGGVIGSLMTQGVLKQTGAASWELVDGGGALSFNGRTGNVVLQLGDVLAVLGYSPADKATKIIAGGGLQGGGDLTGNVTLGLPYVGTPGVYVAATVTTDPFGRVTAAVDGSGSTLAIGNTVTGGTAKSVLFVDASGKLGQDNARFAYDSSIEQLQMLGGVAGGFAVVLGPSGSVTVSLAGATTGAQFTGGVTGTMLLWDVASAAAIYYADGGGAIAKFGVPGVAMLYASAGGKTATFGDATNSGTFSDGTRSAALCTGIYGLSMTDGTYSAILCHSGGPLAARFDDGTRFARFASNGHAGEFTDGTRTVYICDGTNNVLYTPAVGGNWSGSPPTDVWVALDRLAAWIAANNTVFTALGITTSP